MKLGLFSYSYHLAFGKHELFTPLLHPKMDIFTFIDKANSLGLEGIQIDICHLQSHEPTYLSKVRDYAQQHDLYIEYGSTGVEWPHIDKQLEIAKQLGAKLMRTYMGFNRYDPAINAEHEVNNAIDILRKVEKKAQQYGVMLAIENHCDANISELEKLMKEVHSPNIGLCVDLGNFMIHQESPTEAIRRLAPYIVNTHFKDYAMKMENWGFKSYGVPLGEGVIELDKILTILKNESKLDRIMLEIPVEKEGDETATLYKENEYVEKSVRYARDILGIC